MKRHTKTRILPIGRNWQELWVIKFISISTVSFLSKFFLETKKIFPHSFLVRDFLRESQIIPNLIENCDHCIQIIQIKFKSGANVSLGNRIYGNHAVFNVGLVEWEQVFKYQTMFLIDADINCDPNCVSIHWLIANMKSKFHLFSQSIKMIFLYAFKKINVLSFFFF